MTTAEWTILKLLDWTSAYFTEHAVPNPRLDAELLLSDVLALKRIDLYLNFEKPVAPTDLARFKTYVQRRARREPLQYIVGHTDFFGRRFAVTPDVLIPRPETEQLVARALEWLDAHPQATRVLDFGTGSGCIAITLACERPQLHVTAMDVSEKAIKVASQNAASLGVSLVQVTGGTERGPHFRQQPSPVIHLSSESNAGDADKWGASVTGPVTCHYYNLIISNPPYIPSKEIPGLQPEISQYEPHLALDGGDDGLAFYRQLLSDAAIQLRSGGALVLEIGDDQGDAILNIATAIGKWQTPKRYNDLSGIERIMIFELKD
jgi:release factor glutamine methyltransferase